MNVNLKQQNVGETIYLVWEIADTNLRVDSFAMKMMSYNHIANITPTQVVQMDDRRQVQFNITGLTKVNSIAATIMPKKEALALFNSILNAFDEMEAYMLDTDHVLLDWDYVYLDRQQNCVFLYLPFDSAVGKDKIDFLHEVVSRIKPDYQEQDHYLYDILNAFSRGAIHTTSDFRELIKKSAGTTGGGQRKEQRIEPSKEASMQEQLVRLETSNKEERMVPLKRTSTNSRMPVMNIPGRETGVKMTAKEPEKKKKSQFSFAISRRQKASSAEHLQEESKTYTAGFQQERQDLDTSNKEMYERYEDTMIMPIYANLSGSEAETAFAVSPSARLVRKKNGEAYFVEGDRVMIGSGTAADICVTYNNTISRSHAFICYINGQYYLEDNHSRNGSFINGVRLQAGKQEPVYSGMTIRLSNEEFTFVIG
ncbi:MAG: FHA domain-containing protein [Eubacterium sp.]|nr:FHA domain-containing protein [Eubacterium sp.]